MAGLRPAAQSWSARRPSPHWPSLHTPALTWPPGSGIRPTQDSPAEPRPAAAATPPGRRGCRAGATAVQQASVLWHSRPHWAGPDLPDRRVRVRRLRRRRRGPGGPGPARPATARPAAREARARRPRGVDKGDLDSVSVPPAAGTRSPGAAAVSESQCPRRPPPAARGGCRVGP